MLLLRADQRACIEKWAIRSGFIQTIHLCGRRAKGFKLRGDIELALTYVHLAGASSELGVHVALIAQWEWELRTLLGEAVILEHYHAKHMPEAILIFAR